MLPTKEEAEKLLAEAEKCNPGPWGNHSRVAAHCAEKIARECDGLDADKAYILGLLHDIGRKYQTVICICCLWGMMKWQKYV